LGYHLGIYRGRLRKTAKHLNEDNSNLAKIRAKYTQLSDVSVTPISSLESFNSLKRQRGEIVGGGSSETHHILGGKGKEKCSCVEGCKAG
jgi:hypothetical protein